MAYKRYDAIKFLKRNVEYYLTDKFNIKNIDKYILEGKILTLDNRIRKLYKK